MSIVVTSNDGKNNSSRLGKITSDNLNYKTCLVRVLNASYRCTLWKFSKKAGYAKILFNLDSDGNWLYAASGRPIKRRLYPATFNVIELQAYHLLKLILSNLK